MQAMMKDQFANYVVQKVLETCDDQQRELILSRIKVHLNALKKYTYGKHIVARVEKLVAWRYLFLIFIITSFDIFLHHVSHVYAKILITCQRSICCREENCCSVSSYCLGVGVERVLSVQLTEASVIPSFVLLHQELCLSIYLSIYLSLMDSCGRLVIKIIGL
jgi:hypothetical protein